MGEMRNEIKIFVGKFEGKGDLLRRRHEFGSQNSEE
jgi:hypothetical protein